MSDNVRDLPRCQGVKADGSPCERIVRPSQRFCFSHDPNRSEERSANASRAAKSKLPVEMRNIKTRLKNLAEDVLSGKVAPGKASVANQCYGMFLRTCELEYKLVDMEEVREEIAEVKEMYQVHREYQ